MDNELAYLRSIAQADWFLDLAVDAYWTRSGLPWADRLEKMQTGLRENGGLEAYEHPAHARTIVAWPSGTRRKHPAFIAIHAGQYQRFDAVWRYMGASFTSEVVEAGKNGVAGHGPITDLRAEA
jgi:hypothetical protein